MQLRRYWLFSELPFWCSGPRFASRAFNANMETFLPDRVRATLLGLIAIAFIMTRLARWFPNVAWLQVFRLPLIKMTEARREKRRRSSNRMAGLEMVLAGAVLPLVYFASTVMFFNEPETMPTIIVTACSVLCIGLGIWIFVRNW